MFVHSNDRSYSACYGSRKGGVGDERKRKVY
nr:MAG TPA: hypothetical protein [Caudoviricetes sp.]